MGNRQASLIGYNSIESNIVFLASFVDAHTFIARCRRFSNDSRLTFNGFEPVLRFIFAIFIWTVDQLTYSIICRTFVGTFFDRLRDAGGCTAVTLISVFSFSCGGICVATVGRSLAVETVAVTVALFQSQHAATVPFLSPVSRCGYTEENGRRLVAARNPLIYPSISCDCRRQR